MAIEKSEKNTHDLKNNGTESTTKDATIKALKNEIDILKKKVAEQDETIDDLVQERDDVYDEMFEVRLILADAWNIKRDSNAEKIWAVLERTRIIKQTQIEKKKPYSEAVKSNASQVAAATDEKKNKKRIYDESAATNLDRYETIQVEKKPYSEVGKSNESQLPTVASEDGKHLDACGSTDSADSGFGNMHSLTQLIDERVNLAIDTKNRENTGTWVKQMNDKSEKFTQILRSNLFEDRDNNVIIHGLKENDKCDTELVKEIFEATTATLKPTHTMRLGQRRDDKIRPLMLTMKNKDDKENFMSKLWMLKNVRQRLGNISITHDYTLEERSLIKKWVEEAERRNQQETNEYRWKVRGTPRTGLRLIQIKRQE